MKTTFYMIFFAIVLYLFVHDSVTAQSRQFFTIEGTIKDKSTLEPLVGVNVFLNNTTLRSTTDREGHYKILKVPGGKFELVISMVGYQAKKKKISIDKKNVVSPFKGFVPLKG